MGGRSRESAGSQVAEEAEIVPKSYDYKGRFTIGTSCLELPGCRNQHGAHHRPIGS